MCVATLLPDHAGFAQSHSHSNSVPHGMGKKELPDKAGLKIGTVAVFALEIE